MKYVGSVLFNLVILTILIYLWLGYGVREYCLGCGKSGEEHDIAACPTNTTFNKLIIAFGLTVAGGLVFFVIHLLLSIL